MASLNKVILMGNVTRDLDLRYTPNGAAVCDMGLAINRRIASNDGHEREETTFVDIVIWNKQAESCSRYLRKGSQCLVEGRLQLDTWDDKETGQKRSRLRVVAERVQFLGGRGDNIGGVQTQYQQPQAGVVGQVPPQQQYQAQQVPPAPQVQQPVPAPAFGNQPQSTTQQPMTQPQMGQPMQQPAQPMQQPSPQAPPAMPDGAFDANSVEDDIPF